MLGFFQGLGENPIQTSDDVRSADDFLIIWNKYSAASNEDQRMACVNDLRKFLGLQDGMADYDKVKDAEILLVLNGQVPAATQDIIKAIAIFTAFATGKLIVTPKKVQIFLQTKGQKVDSFLNVISQQLKKGNVVASEETQKAISEFSKAVQNYGGQRSALDSAFVALKKTQKFDVAPVSELLKLSKADFTRTLINVKAGTRPEDVAQVKNMNNVLSTVFFLQGFLLGRKGSNIPKDFFKSLQGETFGQEIDALQNAIIETFPIGDAAAKGSSSGNAGLFVVLALGAGLAGAAYYFSTQNKQG